MDRHTLRDVLLAGGLPPESFQIAGVHEHRPAPTDYWFLRPAPGGRWEVGLHERGTDDVRGAYATEADACDLLRRALTGTGPG